MNLYPCPCCGYATLDEPPPGSFKIYPICFWEDDSVQFDDPDYRGGANEVSLKEAKKNYSSYQVSELRFKEHVREPTPKESDEKKRRKLRAKKNPNRFSDY